MIKINAEFGDRIILEISEQNRLELELIDGRGHGKRSRLDAFQLDKLIMELKIIKESKVVKYPDERSTAGDKS